MAHINHGILCSHKKGWVHVLCRDLDEAGNHHSQQTMARTENQTLHVLTHRWELNSENTWTQEGEHHTLGPVMGWRSLWVFNHKLKEKREPLIESYCRTCQHNYHLETIMVLQARITRIFEDYFSRCRLWLTALCVCVHVCVCVCVLVRVVFSASLFFWDGISLCRSGWSAVAQSQLTATSASWFQGTLVPQPPE